MKYDKNHALLQSAIPELQPPVRGKVRDVYDLGDSLLFVATDRISCERATYTFRHPGSPYSFLAVFRDYYGPTMNAFAAARDDGREAQLQSELSALFESQNRGDAGRTEIPATFLKVTVAV